MDGGAENHGVYLVQLLFRVCARAVSVDKAANPSHSKSLAFANERARSRGPDEETTRYIYQAFDYAIVKATFFPKRREVML